jgi:hypothetical protein
MISIVKKIMVLPIPLQTGILPSMEPIPQKILKYFIILKGLVYSLKKCYMGNGHTLYWACISNESLDLVPDGIGKRR